MWLKCRDDENCKYKRKMTKEDRKFSREDECFCCPVCDEMLEESEDD
jgi:hypothetical protein